MYLEALKDFPPADCKLQTEKSVAFCQKVDIFKETLWFSYRHDPSKRYALRKQQDLEILELNKKGVKVEGLEEYVTETNTEERLTFENVVGQDSLTRFDRPKRKKNKKRSEEHTSELQSLTNLVCRLLLEKKKTT